VFTIYIHISVYVQALVQAGHVTREKEKEKNGRTSYSGTGEVLGTEVSITVITYRREEENFYVLRSLEDFIHIVKPRTWSEFDNSCV
jgi:hypothetical protein